MFAGDVLVRNAVVKLKDQDVILTYAFSSVVLAVLLKAFEVWPSIFTIARGAPFRIGRVMWGFCSPFGAADWNPSMSPFGVQAAWVCCRAGSGPQMGRPRCPVSAHLSRRRASPGQGWGVV